MFFWREEILPGRWAAFTNTEAGNLALHVQDVPASVLERRAHLEAAMGVVQGSLRFMNQTHSASAVAVDDVPEGSVIDADALISVTGEAPLAVMVADCVPVILSAQTIADGAPDEGPGGATAVVHAGRQGTLDGIITTTVGQLRSRGAGSISAWIGPAICGACYEVPASLQQEVAAAVPAAASTTRWGTPGLDLPGAVRAQLLALGVTVRQVGSSDSQLCTLENDSLYSHRRSPASGRMAGLVWTQ